MLNTHFQHLLDYVLRVMADNARSSGNPDNAYLCDEIHRMDEAGDIWLEAIQQRLWDLPQCGLHDPFCSGFANELVKHCQLTGVNQRTDMYRKVVFVSNMLRKGWLEACLAADELLPLPVAADYLDAWNKP